MATEARLAYDVPTLALKSGDLFSELRPFYQLCISGLIATALFFPALLWTSALRSAGWAFVVVMVAYAVVTIYSIYRWWRARRDKVTDAIRSLALESSRLTQKLDFFRAALRRFTGDDKAELVLTADTTIVLSTLRSRDPPIVEMSSGFWSTYGHNPNIVAAAIAHEAGHIAARDVETFRGLTALMGPLAFGALATAICFFSTLADNEERPFAFGSLYMVAFSAVGVALSWSALLVAREVQADAYAALVLNSEESVRDLLLHQLNRRRQQAVTFLSRLRGFCTWLIQPNLKWRVKLPALRGNVGSRVEIKLGIATVGFLIVAYLTALHLGTLFGPIPAVAVPVAAAFYYWLAYTFLWGRNRALGGRTLWALVRSLGSFANFCIPAYLIQEFSRPVVRLLLVGVDPESPFELHRYLLHSLTPYMGIFPAQLFIFWAVSKCTLVGRREQLRRSPSFFRLALGLIGLYGIIAIMTYFRTGYIQLLPRALETNDVFAILFVGVITHLLAPPAKRRQFVLATPISKAMRQVTPSNQNVAISLSNLGCFRANLERVKDMATYNTGSGSRQFAPGLIFRDVVIIWVLTYACGLVAGVVVNAVDPQRVYIALGIARLLAQIIGFIISGCLVHGRRWKHVFIVASVLWIADLIDLAVGLTIPEWLFRFPVFLLLATVGGGISYLIRR